MKNNIILYVALIAMFCMSCSKEFENINTIEIKPETIALTDATITGAVGYVDGTAADTAIVELLVDGEILVTTIALMGTYTIEIPDVQVESVVLKIFSSGFSPGYALLELDGSESYEVDLTLGNLYKSYFGNPGDVVCVCDGRAKFDIETTILQDHDEFFLLHYAFNDLIREPDEFVLNTDAINLDGVEEELLFRNLVYVNVTDSDENNIDLLTDAILDVRTISDVEGARLWFYNEAIGKWEEKEIREQTTEELSLLSTGNFGRVQFFDALEFGYYALSSSCLGDTSDPVFTCKENYTVSMGTSDQRAVSGNRMLESINDDCDGYPMVLIERLDNTDFCTPEINSRGYSVRICPDDLGIIVPVEITAYDDAGNKTVCQSEIWVTE